MKIDNVTIETNPSISDGQASFKKRDERDLSLPVG
jgi:hypothetical protein